MVPSTATFAAALMALPAATLLLPSAQAGDVPNMVFILADDQGWGDVGYNDYTYQNEAYETNWTFNPCAISCRDPVACMVCLAFGEWIGVGLGFGTPPLHGARRAHHRKPCAVCRVPCAVGSHGFDVCIHRIYIIYIYCICFRSCLRSQPTDAEPRRHGDGRQQHFVPPLLRWIGCVLPHTLGPPHRPHTQPRVYHRRRRVWTGTRVELPGQTAAPTRPIHHCRCSPKGQLLYHPHRQMVSNPLRVATRLCTVHRVRPPHVATRLAHCAPAPCPTPTCGQRVRNGPIRHSRYRTTRCRHLGDFFYKGKPSLGALADTAEKGYAYAKWPVSNPGMHGFDEWHSTEASGYGAHTCLAPALPQPSCCRAQALLLLPARASGVD